MIKTHTITLPFTYQKPHTRTDSLDDLYINIHQLSNYTGQVLLMNSLLHNHNYEPQTLTPNYRSRSWDTQVTLPMIFHGKDMTECTQIMPHRLFRTAVTQLVSHYEIFLSDILKEIHRWNGILKDWEKRADMSLLSDDFDMDDLEEVAIDEAVTPIIMQSYPRLVSTFKTNFKIDIHDEHAPLSLPVVHNLMELRNIIVHHDGHASKIYLKRTAKYRELGIEKLLIEEYDAVELDFQWFFGMAEEILKLGCYIDAQARAKWELTEAPNF